MGLFSLFWDIRQDERIREAQSKNDRNALDVQSTQHELQELRAAVDQLGLLNQALWELLRDRGEMSDADLRAKVDEVDRRDGALDGRVGQAVEACPKCRKPNAATRTRCLYCGATLR